MTRHGKNATASSVYSYSERRKDAKESGYGTLHERLGADSFKEFDCCSLTLQPCREPVITPGGFIFDKEAVLEYILQQKRENARKLKEWGKQLERDQQEIVDLAKAEQAAKVRKFTALEGTPAHPGVRSTDDYDLPGPSKKNTDEAETTRKRPHGKDDDDSVSNMNGKKSKQLPSFWIPELNPTATATKLEKPTQKVLCPMSGKVLKVKDLMPVTFTPITDGDDKTKMVAKKVRYMCPITHDALTNTSLCAYLKTSGNVVTMNCVEQIIRKDMIDPTNGKTLEESDIIPLQRGGTGYAATNQVKAKLARPVLELQ